MIIEALFNLLYGVINTISLLPNIPNFPSIFITSIQKFQNLLFENLQLLDFFFPLELMKVAFPIIVTFVIVQRIFKIFRFAFMRG